jgi:2-iminobutanoate/2-iminopropanoate deaminase
MKRQLIYSDRAPAPGPYSQAVKYNGLLFVSGQTPEDPATGETLRADIAAQTELVLNNIKAILEAGASGPEKVLKVNIYLSDIKLKPAMDEVYRRHFPQSPPARIALAVKGLDGGVDLEIDLIAACD